MCHLQLFRIRRLQVTMADVGVLLILVTVGYLPVVSSGSTRTANFWILPQCIQESTEPWSEVSMADVDCMLLALVSGFSGFNIKLDGEEKTSRGYCQLVNNVDEQSLSPKVGHVFYSPLAIVVNFTVAEVSVYCSNDPCSGASQRYIAIAEDDTKYLDCGDMSGDYCEVLQCDAGLSFDQSSGSCYFDCAAFCSTSNLNLRVRTDPAKFVNCAADCVEFDCPPNLIFNEPLQICDWP